MKEDTYSVYVHHTPDGMYYTGVTKQQLSNRWQPSHYKDKSLWPYIEQYGWENIEHAVIADGLTYEKSREVEDMLILFYRSIGKGINKNRSGLVYTSDINTYARDWQRNKYANDPEFAERDRQYHRQKRATPEGRIYGRVHTFNRRHPDRAIETPLEARDKYLESGYIPNYIKNDDLI